MKLKEIQHSLQTMDIDGWLLYDNRRSNSLAWAFLDIPAQKTTRRFFYWIPQIGQPIKIVPLIEPYTLDHLPGDKLTYVGWIELEKILFSLTVKHAKIAMEVSPFNALPSLSNVDAGMVQWIEKNGAKVVSSAELLQKQTSRLTPGQLESHLYAAKVLDDIATKTWKFIEKALQDKSIINECDVQSFMLKEMAGAGCISDHPPVCAVGTHTADPHYSPTLSSCSLIKEEDFILIDLWCKQKVPHAVYADITRVAVAAKQPTTQQNEIFSIVKEAQTIVTTMIEESLKKKKLLLGWQVDQKCRDFIQKKGYGDYFIHRTGHHIGEEVHGPGANLDNLETHDDRHLLLGTCFSVEPGIYLPGEFGIRLEHDVYLHDDHVMQITGGVQNEIICLHV